ncbi:MAG: pimeloyl-ACP methyl ester esterase BioH [Methylococcales symbiont of Hymedesmia sp. n. MRB-2018]|nr:MAG: pimeloyl-ACP methyl ester esterase BioH [Methylococcales symbiont of Hymedesmia sp. n. MRB-2018]KAF3982931.1 MAG: pimeloyl-ACP methyl ester esterase BioH [Methylococcales symbiont of Hymedesmia sp. n. MRB-2018]
MIKVHKEVYGRGKAIVLIHGWAMHTGIWRPFAQQLAQNYQVTCLDVPGHGLSEVVEPFTLEKISGVLIDETPDTPFCLLGWSLGASIAITMAKQYPDRIDSLICLAGNPKFTQTKDWPGMQVQLLEEFAENLQLSCQSTLLRFLTLQVHSLTNGKKLLKQLKSAIHECEPPTETVLKQALEILKRADLREDIATLKCALMIIQGDKDTLVPLQTGHGIQKLPCKSELSIISGAGHVPFLSHSSELIQIMRGFV